MENPQQHQITVRYNSGYRSWDETYTSKEEQDHATFMAMVWDESAISWTELD